MLKQDTNPQGLEVESGVLEAEEDFKWGQNFTLKQEKDLDIQPEL